MNRTQWKILAVTLIAILALSTFLTRPTMYVDDFGKCIIAEVENPKNGIPQRVTCDSLTAIERFIARRD